MALDRRGDLLLDAPGVRADQQVVVNPLDVLQVGAKEPERREAQRAVLER
jgi:hypothetical protein